MRLRSYALRVPRSYRVLLAVVLAIAWWSIIGAGIAYALGGKF